MNDAVWAPNDPVDTNDVESKPSKKSAFTAYEEVPVKFPITLPNKLLVIPFETFKDPVISVLIKIDTVVSLSLILLLYKWSPPCPLKILLNDGYVSSPNDPVFLGPDMKPPPAYEDPLAFWYTRWFLSESQAIEAVALVEPES